MQENIFLGLVNNAALLLALWALYNLVSMRSNLDSWWEKVLTGFAIGVLGIAVMYTTMPFTEGIVFDTRSILLSISALFFGAIPVLIAAVMTSVFRVTQGGGGAIMGVLVIFSSSAIGLAWRYLRNKRDQESNWLELYILGIVVHIVMLLCAFSLPKEMTNMVLNQIGLPVMIIYPVVTVALGVLFSSQLTRKKLSQELVRSEQKYKQLFQSLAAGFSYSDMIFNELQEPIDYRFIEVNPAYEELTGLKAEKLIGRRISEVLPKLDPYLIKTYGEVVKTGNSTTFEYCSKDIQKHFEITAYSPTNGKFAIIMLDISRRKQIEKEFHKSHEQLRALTNYLQTAIENERAHIAREIHDEFGQLMTGLKMDIGWIIRNFKDMDALLDRIKSMDKLVDEAIKTSRRLSSELRPGLLDNLGLIPAIEWYIGEFSRRSGIKCSFHFPNNPINLQTDLKTTIYRIFQETLTNIARHAEATEASILFGVTDDQLILTITDNGRGITSKELDLSRSLGLLGMQERAVQKGGNIEIYGKPDEGTTVTAIFPLSSDLLTEDIL